MGQTASKNVRTDQIGPVIQARIIKSGMRQLRRTPLAIKMTERPAKRHKGTKANKKKLAVKYPDLYNEYLEERTAQVRGL